MLAVEINYVAHLTAFGWQVFDHKEKLPDGPANRLATLIGWKMNVDTDPFQVSDSCLIGAPSDIVKAIAKHGSNPFPKSPPPAFRPDDAFQSLLENPSADFETAFTRAKLARCFVAI